MKKARLFLFILFVLFLAFFLKNQILKTTLTASASKIMGAPVTLRQFSFGIFQQSIVLTDLKVYNPPGFDNQPFLDAPLIKVEYVLTDLLAGKLHFKNITFSLKELVIIKDREGKLNVDALKVAKPKEKSTSAKAETELPLKIDILELSIGKIILKDYTAGEPPKIRVHDIGYKKQIYRNITSAQQLAALIISQGLQETAIKGAKIYAASSLLGIGFIPAGVAMSLIKSDTAEGNFDHPVENVYAAALKTLKDTGSISSEDPSKGTIKGVSDRHSVEIQIYSVTKTSTRVRVSARRFWLPKPDEAEVVLVRISDNLNDKKEAR